MFINRTVSGGTSLSVLGSASAWAEAERLKSPRAQQQRSISRVGLAPPFFGDGEGGLKPTLLTVLGGMFHL